MTRLRSCRSGPVAVHGIGALVLAALLGSGCFVGRFWASPWPAPSQPHRVRTADGWELELRRVPAQGPRRPHPVVVQHGIVTNGRNCDLDSTHSLARHLAARGWDVWVPSLRGTGGSGRRSLDGARADYRFDDFVRHDVAAVLAHVRAATGASEVDWVGHSMGGMLVYAWLSGGGGGIHRAVTLGSPVRLSWSGRLEKGVRDLAGLAGLAARLPLRTATLSTLPLQGSWSGPVERLLVTDATDPEVWRRFLAVGVDDLPPGLVEQFAGWLQRDRFDSADGATDYLGGLARVRIPVLVVAGRADAIAPPWTVRPAFEALGSPEKRWLVVGEANGMSADYAHMDLLLAEKAPEDVFTRVAAFLER